MRPATYLVFGDLHGRVLPAFRLAQAWSARARRRPRRPAPGRRPRLLPRPGPLRQGHEAPRGAGRARGRRAARGPAQRGGRRRLRRARLAPGRCGSPRAIMKTTTLLKSWSAAPAAGRTASRSTPTASCAASATAASPSCRAGCASGASGASMTRPRARASGSRRAPHQPSRHDGAGGARFDVLLAHESPRDAILSDQRQRGHRLGHPFRPAGVRLLRPLPPHRVRVEGDFGATRVYHLSHLELRLPRRGGSRSAC